MRVLFASCVLVLSIAGCSQPPATTGDAGMDAGPARDGGSADAGTDTATDVAIPDTGGADGGAIVDDGGSDSGLDAAIVSGDAGLDSGLDAAIASGDAGHDAGRDAGMDAAVDAAVTTCAIGVAPTAGTTADDFAFDVVSNGTGCAVVVDAGAPFTVPCNVAASYPGSFFGVGTHDVRLTVAGGPSGAATCSTSFRVDAAPDAGPRDAGPDSGVTTCAVSVTPSAGTTADTYTFMASSNGSACSVSVDGGAPQAIPCTASYPTMAPAGTHTVVLSVGAGPGGPTTCMTTVTVTAAPDAGPRDAGPDAGVTTCTIDVTPTTGSATTSFTVTATSNGTACDVRLDGGAPLVVPCTGSMSVAGSLFGTGAHTLTLEVSGGPSGATSCADTFTVTP